MDMSEHSPVHGCKNRWRMAAPRGRNREYIGCARSNKMLSNDIAQDLMSRIGLAFGKLFPKAYPV